ncbi:MAG: L-aspartate oxidase [Endozoicomonadaceae bacterium]|nr:L-aspartate oxidase [Endozoicomonadaceae bacterium]
MEQQSVCDVLILGCGLAGLNLALQLSPAFNTVLMCKDIAATSASWNAQGGVAAVMDVEDSVDQHIADTLKAGAGLCDERIVRFTIEQGKKCIDWLQQQGVPFTRNQHDHQLHLTREGGHTYRRIAHVADTTGKAIISTLLQRIHSAPNITLMENYTAIDLVTTNKPSVKENRCIGIYALNTVENSVYQIKAKAVVLATGGASRVYLYSSSNEGACGDGIAMAWRAGCRVANMEFNQFHPTCLYHPKMPAFLISEAVRGEGGKLLTPEYKRFMDKYDPRAELASRDIVARAIDCEMKRLGCTHMYLDISHKPASFIKEHFPNIYNQCLKCNIDMTQEPIPVVPAAHYTCGGVMVDNHGRTDIQGLYAIGETSFTGFHGANRLASNSLLECLVFSHYAAAHMNQTLNQIKELVDIPAWDSSMVSDSDEDVVISHNWMELRRFMWNYVGVVRTNKRLYRAMNRIELLHQEVREFYNNFKVSHNLIELRHLIQVAELIVKSALQRKESRGLHYTQDYTATLPQSGNTILTPDKETLRI